MLNLLDWAVIVISIGTIVGYGMWRTRKNESLESYFLGNKKAQWWSICLGIMATQASAITFLSTPGQAYSDGLRFIQFYLGLPLAMVVLSITAVPIYSKLNVFTAYQYLETRFGVETRTLASVLFLLQRGLSTGITIYAPSIVLSAALGWNLNLTIVLIGLSVILYTVAGGNRAVSVTHKQQMLVIFLGMAAAGYMVIKQLPQGIGIWEATKLAGAVGKINPLNLNFDLKERYNLWSGLIGGFFLQLSYFGTDQSQVGRYLGGESITQSRMGLIINGLVKIPMQLAILFLGILLFVFYQFHLPPLVFNPQAEEMVLKSAFATDYKQTQSDFAYWHHQNAKTMRQLSQAANFPPAKVLALKQEAKLNQAKANILRNRAKEIIRKTDPKTETRDSDYIFITFILHQLPHGLVGLLLVVMLSAAMSSTSSALTSLGSTSVVDIYKRLISPSCPDKQQVLASRLFIVFWGLVAIGFALVAGLLDNLIQAVNILGSLFYGCILGIFLCGFYLKRLNGTAVFVGALMAEAVVIFCYLKVDSIGYLWYNVIGCLLVAIFAGIIEMGLNLKKGMVGWG